MYFKLRLIPAAAAAALMAACGGGGGGDSAPNATATRGLAVDGYLRFSKVVCDSNDNGVADAGEPVTYTNISGSFVFTSGCTHSVLASGGTSADTGLEFVGQLRAPAGAAMVTPLTTLIASGMTQAEVNAALNLPDGTNLLTKDPAATDDEGALLDSTLLKKTLAVQQMLQKTTELFTGLGAVEGSLASTAVYTEVAAAFAAQLKTGAALFDSSNAISTSKVNTLVSAAVTRTGNASTVSADIKSALTAAGGAATLATVVESALAGQAQAIMDATTPANITAVTLDRQGNSNIADTVKAAVEDGTLSTSTSPADLETLKTKVTDTAELPTVTPGQVPSPASGSTLLLNFDESPAAFSGMSAYGGALPTVAAPPSSDAAMAMKIVKPTGAQAWGGIYFGLAPVAFTDTRKTITAAVYSTKANAVIKLKAEATDASSVEVAGTTTGAANTWSTVTWNLSGVIPTKSYTTIAITPDQETTTSGKAYYIDNLALAPAEAVVGPSNYVYLQDNAIGFSANGTTGAAVSYSMDTFMSTGINVSWPMVDAAALKLNLKENGTFTFAAGQTLSAAVQIEEDTPAGGGKILAFTDGVTISKSGTNITLSVPTTPQALIYGVSSDGQTKAVINFASKVRGITNTLRTASGAVSTVMFGEVVNYAISGLSNQFTKMGDMRGKYKVTIVVDQLPLRKADGSTFSSQSISVPTTVSGGVEGSPVVVTGKGLVGYINLTD